MKVYPDIGELGWSLYLYGYVSHKSFNSHLPFAVMPLPDRLALYQLNGIETLPLPNSFYLKYAGRYAQDGFGLFGVSDQELRKYFADHGIEIAEEFRFQCHRFFEGKTFYRPIYRPNSERGRNRILVFPRRRLSQHHAKRNAAEGFYAQLENTLCEAFPGCLVTFVGVPSGADTGAYRQASFQRNLHNCISPDMTIGRLVDLCNESLFAVGGTSAPPKISLLQGVPTFIFGHEKKRFLEDDNWMKTKAGFFEFGADEYQTFDQKAAIEAAVAFGKEVLS